MRILILPDVHNRWEKVEKIIKLVAPDQVIFLGDYFDDFGDDPHTIAETADWFQHSVHQPNRIHLCGNHDIHYWQKDNPRVRCSGYDQYKSIAINDIVQSRDWEKLKFFHVLDNKWLLSHAGVHPAWLNPSKFKACDFPQYSLSYLKKRLKTDSEACLVALGRFQHHWFTISGFARGPSPYYGGLLWCDWNKEFHPVQGIHQIVGHTPNYELYLIARKEGDTTSSTLPLRVGVQDWELSPTNSINICLDSQPGSRFYAIYENGKLTIEEVTPVP